MRTSPKLLSAVLLVALSTAVESAQDQAFDLEHHVKRVSIEAGEFAVVDAGEGPAVVLMHGFPDTKEVWESQSEYGVRTTVR